MLRQLEEYNRQAAEMQETRLAAEAEEKRLAEEALEVCHLLQHKCLPGLQTSRLFVLSMQRALRVVRMNRAARVIQAQWKAYKAKKAAEAKKVRGAFVCV